MLLTPVTAAGDALGTYVAPQVINAAMMEEIEHLLGLQPASRCACTRGAGGGRPAVGGAGARVSSGGTGAPGAVQTVPRLRRTAAIRSQQHAMMGYALMGQQRAPRSPCVASCVPQSRCGCSLRTAPRRWLPFSMQAMGNCAWSRTRKPATLPARSPLKPTTRPFAWQSASA